LKLQYLKVFVQELYDIQWRSSPIFLEGKNLGRAQICDFRRATVFLFGITLIKAQND